MSEALGSFVTQFGAGGIGGFLVGYAIKKIVKIIGFLLGLSVLLLFYLEHVGVITVNYGKLAEATAGVLQSAVEVLPAIVGYLPMATSFTGGLALGVMKG